MLKIDRSFVHRLTESKRAPSLVASVVQFHMIGLEPLVEGVETMYQRRLLVEQGCRDGKGFPLSRPFPQTRSRRSTAATNQATAESPDG
jgi:EAL domain-containing protein (putative c-di-GMP-specific phosphodiesterase class I)